MWAQCFTSVLPFTSQLSPGNRFNDAFCFVSFCSNQTILDLGLRRNRYLITLLGVILKKQEWSRIQFASPCSHLVPAGEVASLSSMVCKIVSGMLGGKTEWKGGQLDIVFSFLWSLVCRYHCKLPSRVSLTLHFH